MRKKSLALITGLTASGLLLTGCLGGGAEPAPGASATGPATAKETIQIMYAFSGELVKLSV